MRPCQARARVRHDDIDAAECLDHLRRTRRARTLASVTSHATASAAPPIALAPPVAARSVEIEQRDLRAGRRECLRGGRADGAAGAGDDARSGRRAASASRLPSFACSSDQYSMSNMSASEMRLEAADRLGVGDRLDRGFARDRRRSRRPSRCAPRPNSPRPGTSTTRGSGSSVFLVPPARALLRAK